MKRVLILALLALAVALFALLRSREPRAESLAPPAAESPAARAADVAALESAAAETETARATLAAGTPATDAAPLASLRVRVRFADSNAPVAGAAVALAPAPEGLRTDERGELELRLPIGARLEVLKVRPGEGADVFVPHEHNIDQPLPAAGLLFEVQVDRGRSLRGVVLEQATGRKIEGARVTYLGLGGQTETTTLADGTFELAGLHAGRWTAPGQLAVLHPLYIGTTVHPASSDLAPGAAPLRILLRSGLRVAGRIVDGERAPVAGAILVLAAGDERQSLSDALGRFEIGGLDPTDQATLTVPIQALAERAILGTKKELGALVADRLDLELEVRAALALHIYAELEDGRPLPQSRFELECPAGVPEQRSIWSNVRFSNEALCAVRIVPFGPPIEIEAFASAFEVEDPRAILRGKAVVHPEPGLASPHTVHVVLTERHRLEIPPAPPDAVEQVLSRAGVARGAFDARLIDAESGRPIDGKGPVTLRYVMSSGPAGRTGDPGFVETYLLDDPVQPSVRESGWLRLRAPPGKHTVEVRYGEGPRERFTFAIPWSGHAQAEWRLRTKP